MVRRVLLPAAAAFVLLVVLFSPNWLAFAREFGGITGSGPGEKDAIKRAILSAYAERGYHVTRQVQDLEYEIADNNHKIVRWRLFVPVVARALRLPDWATLGLAHLGCLALILYLAALGSRLAPEASPVSILGFGLTAGATAPFFTSMGWLGYYDSLLALALLATAFERKRLLVIAVCLLAPWIDERFVLGLPLVLLVRLIAAPERPLRDWLRSEAIIPLAIAATYSAVRLGLGGSGGSQTMLQYLEKFVFEQRMDGLQRLFGAWSGLRWSWILVGIGLAAPFLPSVRRRPSLGATLLITAVLTALIALHTALDMSRSTVLLIPLAPLGWLAASRLWRPAHLAAPSLGLGLLSLSTPAHHVFGRFSLPVDSCLKPSSQLMTAQNNLGALYSDGKLGTRDYAAGRYWFQRAAEGEFPSALKNLAFLHEKGLGVPEDPVTAVSYYRRAAELGQVDAQNDLGAILHRGEKVPRNVVEAAKWIREAALQNSVIAQKNLGVLLSRGDGVNQDMVEAAYWFRRAGEAGNAEAQRQLGQLYLSGKGVPLDIPIGVHWLTLAARQGDREAMMLLGLLFSGGRGLDRDPTRAYGWFLRARELGHPEAARLLAELEASMSASELAEARAGNR